MVVNGNVNKIINIERDNVFETAFEKRKEAGLP